MELMKNSQRAYTGALFLFWSIVDPSAAPFFSSDFSDSKWHMAVCPPIQDNLSSKPLGVLWITFFSLDLVNYVYLDSLPNQTNKREEGLFQGRTRGIVGKLKI